ncbi:MAG TPA: FAD-dependent monooxygenase [Kribbellaceae bacterium]|nr:FAD-dependent monooxygenase [Kribbellaceae bacterium]
MHSTVSPTRSRRSSASRPARPPPCSSRCRARVWSAGSTAGTCRTRRVALLGDAAHAMTPNLGQGACAAIEDAAALAALVSEYDEVPAALAAYDRQRRKPTARLVRRSRLMGDLGQLENPVALASRDAVLRLAGGLAGLLARRGKPVRAGVGESGP